MPQVAISSSTSCFSSGNKPVLNFEYTTVLFTVTSNIPFSPGMSVGVVPSASRILAARLTAFGL